MDDQPPIAQRPAIRLTEADADKLTELALRVADRMPQVSNLLLDEIDRAEILPTKAMPATVVTMMAHVEFCDERHGAARTVQLVYPHQADIAQDRISILTPIGAGLIGLSEGQSIEWPDRDGKLRSLRVTKVRQMTSQEQVA